MSKKYLYLIVIILSSHKLIASGITDHYDNTGKLYAVIAVVAITLVGIGAFLFYLEKRLKILEKLIDNE